MKRTVPITMLISFLAVFLMSGTPAANSEQVTKVSIVSVSPAPGSRVDETTLVRATVSYSIEEFPGRQDRDFLLWVKFATTDPDRTTNGTYPERGFPLLAKTSGEASVSFPLQHIWKQAELQRPLTMWVYLVSRFNDGSSFVIAKSDPVKYTVQ